MSVSSIKEPISLNQSIFVKALDGRTIALPFDPLSRLCRYYKDIEQREGIPVCYQRLLYAGKQLQMYGTLSDYGISPNATLHLTLKLLGGMKIFIQPLYGKKYSIEVEPGDSIDNVKQKIQDKTNILFYEQRLIFHGKQLEDYRTLENYGIRQGSIVHMRLRLRGGGSPPLPFVNMKQEKMISFSKEAPEWRIAQPGLNLLGTCINTVCRAYQQSIWIPKGFGKFNMNKECYISLCPICGSVAEKVNNFGVFSCFFSIEGIFKYEDKHISYEKQKTRAAEDQLLSFNDGEGLVSEWYYLNIVTEMPENPNQQKTKLNEASQIQLLPPMLTICIAGALASLTLAIAKYYKDY